MSKPPDLDWYCTNVLSGRVRVEVVADTEDVIAFHHTQPSYRGAHIVVIPKLHVASFLSDDLSDRLLLEVLSVVRAVATDVVARLGECRVITNLGRYQDSEHLHWHVVSGGRVDPSET